MNREQITSNMKAIFSSDDLKRVNVRENKNGLTYIDTDLHGLTRRQAEKFVKNIISKT